MRKLVILATVLAIALSSEISDREEYECIVEYLRINKILPKSFESHHGQPLDNKKCEEALNAYKTSVYDTYSSVFLIHPKTESKVGCIMENFQMSDSVNNILLKFILEDARANKTIDKEFFCATTKTNDEIIEEKMKKSIHPCIPGFEMGSLFDSDTSADECSDESSEFPAKIEFKKYEN